MGGRETRIEASLALGGEMWKITLSTKVPQLRHCMATRNRTKGVKAKRSGKGEDDLGRGRMRELKLSRLRGMAMRKRVSRGNPQARRWVITGQVHDDTAPKETGGKLQAEILLESDPVSNRLGCLRFKWRLRRWWLSVLLPKVGSAHNIVRNFRNLPETFGYLRLPLREPNEKTK